MTEPYHNNRLVVDRVRQDRLPGQPRFEDAPSPRARLWGLLLMACMLALSIYLFLSTNQFFDRFQAKYIGVENSDSARIHRYNQQLEALQDKMTVFVADSVETKLKNLERNVTTGTVGAQELRTLEELKSEVKLLETYSLGKGGNLTDSSRLDHARFQITPGSENSLAGGGLLQEVLELKRLLYLGIASCGLVGLMIGGYCWRMNTRGHRLANDIPTPRLLVGSSDHRDNDR